MTKPAQVPLLCFLHIPKTAGTSLVTVLKKRFQEDESFFYEYHRTFKSLSPKQRRSLRFVHGHFTFGQQEIFRPREIKLFTFLRDPLARVESQFFFSVAVVISGAQKNHMLKPYLDKKSPIEEIIFKSKMPHFDNMAVRQLSGVGFTGKSKKFGKICYEDYQKAQENLEREFTYVGFQDTFSRDVRRLTRKLGLIGLGLKDLPQDKKGAGRKNREYAWKTREDVEALNLFDIQLYHWAKKRFA